MPGPDLALSPVQHPRVEPEQESETQQVKEEDMREQGQADEAAASAAAAATVEEEEEEEKKRRQQEEEAQSRKIWFRCESYGCSQKIMQEHDYAARVRCMFCNRFLHPAPNPPSPPRPRNRGADIDRAPSSQLVNTTSFRPEI